MALRPKHELAQKTLQGLRRGGKNAYGQVFAGLGAFDVSVGPGSIERAVRFVDALLQAMTAELGATFEAGDRGQTSVARVNGEPLRLRLTEEFTRTQHVPTPEEKVRLKSPFPYPRVEKWDHKPTGKLKLVVTETLYGSSKFECADKEGRPLEDALPAIIQGIRELAAEQHRTRQRIEENQRAAHAREVARHRTEERKRKREGEVKALVAEAERWRQATLLNEYATAISRAVAMSEDSLETRPPRFVLALRKAADAIDPLPRRVAACRTKRDDTNPASASD